MRRAIALLGFGVGTLAAAGCAGVFGAWSQAEETFHYQYPISAGGTLELLNQDGPVEISGWDRNEVDISGTKCASTTERLKDIRVDVNATSGSVSIRTIRPDSFWERGSVRYVIHVPRGVELKRVETSNGPIDVDGTNASAHLRTSNGPVRVADVRGELEVETSNGPVRVTDASGPAKLRTRNGPIDLMEDSVHEVHAHPQRPHHAAHSVRRGRGPPGAYLQQFCSFRFRHPDKRPRQQRCGWHDWPRRAGIGSVDVERSDPAAEKIGPSSRRLGPSEGHGICLSDRRPPKNRHDASRGRAREDSCPQPL
jgi:hypothetical protein